MKYYILADYEGNVMYTCQKHGKVKSKLSRLPNRLAGSYTLVVLEFKEGSKNISFDTKWISEDNVRYTEGGSMLFKDLFAYVCNRSLRKITRRNINFNDKGLEILLRDDVCKSLKPLLKDMRK